MTLVNVFSSLNLDTASTIIDNAIKIRKENDIFPLSIVVLDSGGNIVAFKREDNSGILRFDVAVAKATAALGILTFFYTSFNKYFSLFYHYHCDFYFYIQFNNIQ